jgi:uroporphyrinogen decarboxylase
MLNNQAQVPIWIMRQAGRYLPEYREVRASVNSFLELCYDPVKAAEVTMQPINRFGLDAAIIFSDILVLPDALGFDVKFEADIGPRLRKFESEDDFKYLEQDPSDKLNRVYEAISIVKSKLGNKPLIGFVGSPWTVASYMLEGGRSNFEESRKFLYQNRDLSHKLINFLTDHTINHLKGQIKAGASIVKLFDSWAGILPESEYNEFVIEPTRQIVHAIKMEYPHIPIIGFPKGSGFFYEKYIDETKIDIIAVDPCISLSKMREWQDKITVQGNLDPVVLLTDKKTIEAKVNQIFSMLKRENYIFNLGHGILKNTKIENVEFLVKLVREK